MIVYNKNNVAKFDIEIDGQTKLKRGLTGQDMISSVFVSDIYLDLVIGDFILWRGERFTLTNEPSVNKQKVNEFRYNVDFLSPKSLFEKAIMILDLKTDYFLFGSLEDQVNHILSNVNRVLGSNYVISVIPETVVKNIQYKDTDCLTALNDVVGEFEKEYKLEGNNIMIYDTIGTETGLSFQFKNGLKGIERKKLKDNDLATRLYCFGSERNITSGYGFKRLRIAPIERNVDVFGLHEKIKIFEDVYPHRLGTITSIGADINRFRDSGMNFNLNAPGIIIPGVLAKITFNTGDLSGYEFEILSYDDNLREYNLKTYESETGLILPNSTFHPNSGDKYVIHGINLPAEYILQAENDLSVKAEKHLETVSFPSVIYDVVPDATFLRANSIQLNIGDTLTIFDTDLNINIVTRITDLTQTLVDEYDYTIKVGNRIAEGFVRQISSKTSYIDQKVNSEVNVLNLKYNQLRTASKSLTSEIQSPAAITMIGNSLLRPETKGLNFIVSGLRVLPNYSDDASLVFFESCEVTHFTIEAIPKTWTIPSVLRVASDPIGKYFIYLQCNKANSSGEFLVSKEVFKTENESGFYYFLIGVLSVVTDGSRILNTIFAGSGSTSINNVTNITQVNGVSDTKETIKQKYEDNDNTNAFTDAEKTKLSLLGASGAIQDYVFGDMIRLKGSGNVNLGTTEKNDVIIGRFGTDVYELLYSGTGDLTFISSYRILRKTKLTLFP